VPRSDGSRRTVFMRHEGPSARMRLTEHQRGRQLPFDKLQSGWTTWRSRCPPWPSSATGNGASPRPASYIPGSRPRTPSPARP